MKKINIVQSLLCTITVLSTVAYTDVDISNLTTRLTTADYKIQDIEAQLTHITGPFSITKICYEGLIPALEKELATLKNENAYFRICIENFIYKIEHENAQLRSCIANLMQRVQTLECAKGPVTMSLSDSTQASNDSSCPAVINHDAKHEIA